MPTMTTVQNAVIIGLFVIILAVSGYGIYAYFSNQEGDSSDPLAEVQLEQANENGRNNETAENNTTNRTPDYLGISNVNDDSRGIIPTSVLGDIDEKTKGGQTSNTLGRQSSNADYHGIIKTK